MKLLVAMAMVLGTTAAMACPGGHLKTLAVKYQGSELALAEVDMSKDEVRVMNRSARLVDVKWQASKGPEMPQVLCSSDTKACERSVKLGFRLTDDRNGTLLVTLALRTGPLGSGKEMVKIFKVTSFAMSRSVGGCGATVLPDEPKK